MKKISFLLFISFAMFSYQCKKKCIGEPIVIVAFEELKVKILTAENESIFTNNYNIADLEIYENGNKVDYKVENTLPQSTILSFPISITEGVALSSNLGKELAAILYLKYNDLETDTLEIKSFPIMDNNNCNEFYETIQIIYNSKLLKKETRKNCISCNEPITLIKI